ncbi:MAG: hypothetical protein IPM49_14980 [Flavobacteriales bacterium]|nr:hypothetical protein [Flavobacteriales bacterium]
MRATQLVCICLFFACGDRPHSAALRLDVFDEVPKNIEGCGDHYTYDSVEYDAAKCIFLSKLDGQTGFALIMINGVEERLDWSQAESRELSSERYLSVFRNETYTVRLTTTVGKPYDEGSFNTGTLTIEGPGGSDTVNVHGESGC